MRTRCAIRAWASPTAGAVISLVLAGCIQLEGGRQGGFCGGAQDESMCPGGAGTVFDDTERAFGFAARNLGRERAPEFEAGRLLFEAPWVPVEEGMSGDFDGLGPLFHAPSCAACHVRDGRGRPYGEEGAAAAPAAGAAGRSE